MKQNGKLLHYFHVTFRKTKLAVEKNTFKTHAYKI